jgi:hypothetical protein
VVLKIYLADGLNPLLIDQPEENLDNASICEMLVNAIREAKKSGRSSLSPIMQT